MEANQILNNGQERKLKKTLQLRAKKVDVESLKVLGRRLTTLQRLALTQKYGKILNLLEVNVQEGAITALAQYYDPPLRCFTFQDFQLVPTLEEFEQILGLPLEGKEPYRFMGHYVSLPTIANVLKVSARDLREAQRNRKETSGIPREYLEGLMHRSAQTKDWDVFMDILALTIYGIVLFPSIEGLVDLAAIDVFLALKSNNSNLIPALLADVYCSLNFCHEHKGVRILCCLPMLYVWVTAHIFRRNYKAPCPIDDCRMHQIKEKSNREWAEDMAKLEGRNVRWYPKWEDKKDVIWQCGNFPNVPLMGTQGCINYNPTLALRQLGYPLREPPSPQLLEPFVSYYACKDNTELLRKVRNAWNNVRRKGEELGIRSCAVKEKYYQWVKERAPLVKLPFRSSTSSLPAENPPLEKFENEELKEIKEKLMKTEQEKGKLETQLLGSRQEYASLKRDNFEKDQTLEGANKRLKIGYESMRRTGECLKAANKELGLRRQERDKALSENQQLRELLQGVEATQKEELKKMDHMRQQMEAVIMEQQERIKEMERYKEMEVQKYQARLEEERSKVQYLEAEASWLRETSQELRIRFSNLVALANTAIEDMPQYLRIAELMITPFNVPTEVHNFIDYCGDRLGKMKQLVSR